MTRPSKTRYKHTVRVTAEDLYTNRHYRLPASHYYIEKKFFGFEYDHHLMLTGVERDWVMQQMVVKIIHFDGEFGNKSSAEVKEESVTLQKDSESPQWRVIEYDSASVRRCVETMITDGWCLVQKEGYNEDDDSRRKAVKTARSYIGNYPEYYLINNNCEHFIRGVLTGEKESKQVRKVSHKLSLGAGVSVGVGVGVAVGAFLTKMLTK